MAVTIADIAEKCSVSRGAVSQVLRNPNHPRFAAKTRRRIVEAAEELNYIPNTIARQLRHGKTMTLSFVMATNIVELMDEVGRAARKHGYGIAIQFTSSPEEGMEAKAINRAISSQVDGILWNPAFQSSCYLQVIEQLKSSGLPIVVVGSAIEGLTEADFVGFDCTLACKQVIEHFVDRGYNTVVHLTGNDVTPVRKNFIDEFQSKAANYGVRAEVLILEKDEQVNEVLRDYLSAVGKPAGFYCENDWSSIELMRAAQSAGLAIPDEIGIVAMGDVLFGGCYRLGELVTPCLTAIRRPYRQMAFKAVELLVERIEEKYNGAGRDIILPMELIQRESTCRESIRA